MIQGWERIKMKLSIAIPTLNRASCLEFTLRHFISQVSLHNSEVEIVICSNNSDDNTAKVMIPMANQFDFVHFHDCKERLPLGEQFKRTVAFSHGEYVILWGDDDIPAPYLIDYLLHVIEKHGNCGLFYMNRLVGYEEGNAVKSLTVYDNLYQDVERVYKDSTQFITDNFWGATFMSAVLFSREVWNNGLKFDTSSHYGFEFMGILYYGNKGRDIVYENFPLCIQRKVAHRAWGTDWPKYALLGLPNMARDLEKEGIFRNGLNIWRKRYNKFPLFCYILMSAATDKKKYRPYCSQFASYQNGLLRKSLVYAIINLMPGFVYNVSRNILFKLKK